MKLADTFLRGRDDAELNKAESYLNRDEEFLKKIFDTEDNLTS